MFAHATVALASPIPASADRPAVFLVLAGLAVLIGLRFIRRALAPIGQIAGSVVAAAVVTVALVLALALIAAAVVTIH